MKLMAVSEMVAHFLKENGVRHVFGLPGGETLDLQEAFRKAGIQFVLTHHEAAAGYAADVTGQLTGLPGVCLATVGPGAVNLLAAAAGATLERSPMIAITAEVDLNWQPRVTHMQIDLNRLFAPVVKASYSLRPETAWRDLHQAWRLSLTPPFGAVHLSLSPDTAAAPAHPPTAPIKIPAPPGLPLHRLEAAAPTLQAAANPWILAGLGVEMAGAQAALYNLAEAWGVPVAVTPKAKGHFPDDHPLYAGCFTAYGDAPLRAALESADMILGVGLDGVDFVTSTWDIGTPVINVSCGGAADPVTQPIFAIDGDLAALLAYLGPLRRPHPTGIEAARRVREGIYAALETGATAQEGVVRLLPFITGLRNALPQNGAVTVDVGVFKLVFLQAWRTLQPNTVFVANGLSAMGYAVPGAVGVKLAQPDRPVVAIVGDGALHMYTGELGTVARLGLPIVVVVIVDQALALIRLKQLRKNLTIVGTEFQPTNYEALAAAFGLDYRLIRAESTAQAILKDSLLLANPVLVEVRVDRNEYDHYR
jgi:acetolactate synthase-1/2/3 large subunit